MSAEGILLIVVLGVVSYLFVFCTTITIDTPSGRRQIWPRNKR
jgi:hypothetical protein